MFANEVTPSKDTVAKSAQSLKALAGISVNKGILILVKAEPSNELSPIILAYVNSASNNTVLSLNASLAIYTQASSYHDVIGKAIGKFIE